MSSRSVECTLCSQPLSRARLAAQPGATECVPCLSANGDVPRIKRYDDHYGKDGEDCDEIFFTCNPAIDRKISERIHRKAPSVSATEEGRPLRAVLAYSPTMALNSPMADVDVNLRQYNLTAPRRVQYEEAA
jgi:hypothetical protein